jgi:sugar phosphate permease
MQFPAGILADTYGPRRLITISSFVAGVGAIFFGFAPTYEIAVAARLVIGLGLSCIYVPILKLLAVWFRSNEYATVFGLLLAIGNAGALLAATPLAVLILHFGWRPIIQAIGLTTMIIGGLVYRIVRDAPAVISQRDHIPSSQSKGNPWHGIKTVLTAAQFWPLTIRGIAFYGVLMAFQSLWGGPYLRQVVGADSIIAGNILMMISIGTIVASPISGILSDRVLKSRKGITILSMVLTTLCWLPIALMPERMTPGILYGLFLLFGFVGGLGAAAMAQLKEAFPVALAGTVNGTYNGIVMLSGALYQVGLGFIINLYPTNAEGFYPAAAYATGFRFLLISLAVGTVAMLFTREKKLSENR